jgi:hypothetical protein
VKTSKNSTAASARPVLCKNSFWLDSGNFFSGLIAKLTPTPDLAGFYRRGQNRAVHGDYKLAANDFTEVIKRNPNHAGALNNRCWVRRRFRHPTEVSSAALPHSRAAIG